MRSYTSSFTITICQMSPSYCSQRYFDPKCISLSYWSYYSDQSGRNKLASRQFFMSCQEFKNPNSLCTDSLPVRSKLEISSLVGHSDDYFTSFPQYLQRSSAVVTRDEFYPMMHCKSRNAATTRNSLLACICQKKKPHRYQRAAGFAKSVTKNKKMKQKHESN